MAAQWFRGAESVYFVRLTVEMQFSPTQAVKKPDDEELDGRRSGLLIEQGSSGRHMPALLHSETISTPNTLLHPPPAWIARFPIKWERDAE